MMDSYELNKLFLKQKAKLPLQQIRLYIKARRDFLVPKSNDSSEDTYKGFLFSYLVSLEPDEFFDTYCSDYFGIAKPFLCLCSHFQGINKSDTKLQADLLSLFYFIFYFKEKFPNECLFFLYKRLYPYGEKVFIPDYKTFCDIWKTFCYQPRIISLCPELNISEVFDSLERLNINTTYKKSLIILYSVLYRDYRECERNNSTIEKLRDGYDQIDWFRSPQAVFSYNNSNPKKPRFLNKLFEATVPSDFIIIDKNCLVLNEKNEYVNNEPWKEDFSLVLNNINRCSLDFLINLLIPEAFPSTSAVISYLSQYPSRKAHSVERKVIEIICAYLYSQESENTDKLAVFMDYLKKNIFRDRLRNSKEIYDRLNKLSSSYAVIKNEGEERFRRIVDKVKPLVSSSKRNNDGRFRNYYSDKIEDLEKYKKLLNDVPALDFLIATQCRNKTSIVEDCIVFEEIANYIMYSQVNSVVLLEPSYSYLLKWLTDYRTKNTNTTVVINDGSIVDFLKTNLYDNKLISKEKFYTNQKTVFNLNIETSIRNIKSFDIVFSFYNKNEPQYEDLTKLSEFLDCTNKMLCILPQKFFEDENFRQYRERILTSADIKRISFVDTNLFSYSPKKKLLVELTKANKVAGNNSIPLRFIEIDKELQNVKGNLVKSDLGLYYINKPTQARLELDKRYDGESINFKKTYDKQKSPAKGEKRNKAQKVIFAPDFKIYYTTTQNGNYRQGRAFFAKYNKPLVDKNSKKDYYKKIVESEISISEKDDDSIKKKIINDFFDSLKFERLRNEAKKEIILALKEARLRNISVFTFTFAYSETIENFCGKNFDSNFCFNTLFQTKLGSLILNEATQEDFENAISELNKTKRIDSFKLIKQLGIILDIAKKKAVLYDSKSPVFAYLETRKKDLQIKAKMREAFTKKSLTHNEGRDLIKWLEKRISQKPIYLGILIKLFTGMSNAEVCMLTFGDFCETEYCDCYHFKITKKMGYKSNKREALLSSYKYRIVPIPDYLCGFIQARRNEIQKQFRISYSGLNGLPLISRSKEEYRDYCTTKMLELNSKKALKEGAGISEDLISYPQADKTEEHDLSSYNGDFFESNYKYHALNDAMMTKGEMEYILGLAPHDTFSRHYCDYKNPFLQKKLVEKLNDWCSIYYDYDSLPQFKKGTTKSGIKRRIIKLLPYNSNCLSGQIQLSINEKIQSAIEISVASDRGIKGTVTLYQEDKNAE